MSDKEVDISLDSAEGKYLQEHAVSKEIQEFMKGRDKLYPGAGYPAMLLDMVQNKIKAHTDYQGEELNKKLTILAMAAAMYTKVVKDKNGKLLDGREFAKDLQWLEEKVSILSNDLGEKFPDVEERLEQQAKDAA